MSDLEFTYRLLAGLACGVLVGFERARVGKTTGMRTLGLVGLGAALLAAAVHDASGGDMEVVARVIQGVMAGIGFLGAGVILHNLRRDRARGMTTAAAIWLTSILGTVAGIGQIVPALAVAGAAFVLLAIGSQVDEAAARRFGAGDDDNGLD